MYFHLGGSLRRSAEWLRSEINPGTERERIWDPLSRSLAPPDQQAKLHHTSLWRWVQKVGQRARQKERSGAWRGVIRFSGALVADSTGVLIRGVRFPLHLIGDEVGRVLMRFQHLQEESELSIRGQFGALLEWWGLAVEQVKVLITDGAIIYPAVCDWILRAALHQRSLFHLWRNTLAEWGAYRERVGREAALRFIAHLKRVWDAETLAAAQERFRSLLRVWGSEPELKGALKRVGQTLKEAMVHTQGVVAGMGRSSNEAERALRRYHQRVDRMGCFMSEEGCDNFNGLWMVYVNFEPYQKRKERKRHYCYPGWAPLEIAQAQMAELTWLDVLEI
jgi:hypothetical protein